MSPTASLLKQLEEKAKAATPGPWVGQPNWECSGPLKGAVIAARGLRIADILSKTVGSQDECEANAAFIAGANPQTVLGLIARIRELEGALEVSACECEISLPVNDFLRDEQCARCAALSPKPDDGGEG
jgi:hypothetical protein